MSNQVEEQQEGRQDDAKQIRVEEKVYRSIAEWADKQHRTIGGQVAAMLEVYERKRDPEE